MKTLIMGNGSGVNDELIEKYFVWADFVIAADGGLLHLRRAGFVPDVLLGDFDSIPDALLQDIKVQKDVELVQFPPNKDYTDLELAIDLAIERNTSQLVILGATGTRLDHTTANIHLLYKLIKNDITGYLEDTHNRIYLIDKEIVIDRKAGCKVSILPLPPFANGVSTEGLSYELKNADLAFGTGLGISNEFNDEKARISVKEGLLLIFISRD